MNSFRTISRVVVVTSVIFAGNVSAYANIQQAGSYFYSRKLTAVGMVVADEICAEDEDAKKAAIDTLFYAADTTKSSNLSDIDQKDAGNNFVINYSLRKAGRVLNNNGITFNAVANKCDILPEAAGYYVNPVVKKVSQTVTRPQVQTEIAKFMIGMALSYANNSKK